MNDLIDRQATIDAIEQHKIVTLEGREWDDGIVYGYAAAHRHLVDVVERLPSAEKTGKWIDGWRSGLDGTRYWYRACSECGYEREDDDAGKDTNYCPNCGARMVVSDD